MAGKEVEQLGWLCCSHLWFPKDGVFMEEGTLGAVLGWSAEDGRIFSSGCSGGMGTGQKPAILPNGAVFELKSSFLFHQTFASRICLWVVGSLTPLSVG